MNRAQTPRNAISCSAMVQRHFCWLIRAWTTFLRSSVSQHGPPLLLCEPVFGLMGHAGFAKSKKRVVCVCAGGAHGKVREVQLQVAVQFLLETWRVFFLLLLLYFSIFMVETG